MIEILILAENRKYLKGLETRILLYQKMCRIKSTFEYARLYFNELLEIAHFLLLFSILLRRIFNTYHWHVCVQFLPLTGYQGSFYSSNRHKLNFSSKRVFCAPVLFSIVNSDSSSRLYRPQNPYLNLLGFQVMRRRRQYWICSPDRPIKDNFFNHSLFRRDKMMPQPMGFCKSRTATSPRHFLALQWTDLEPSCKVTHICQERFWVLFGAHPTHKQWFKQNENKTKQADSLQHSQLHPVGRGLENDVRVSLGISMLFSFSECLHGGKSIK